MKLSQIMIIEDEPIIAQNIQYNLEQQGYSKPVIAGSGDEALQKINSSEPDLILMDIQLNDKLDGIELAEKIKNFNIPIIFLTAYADKETLTRALKITPYGYLVKPIGVQKLKTAIDTALQIVSKTREHELELKSLKTIFNNSSTAFAATDTRFTILQSNPQFLKLFGYPILKEQTKSLQQLLPGTCRELFCKLEDSIKNNREISIQEKTVITVPDKTRQNIQINAHTVLLNNAVSQVLFEITPETSGNNGCDIYQNSLNALANVSHDIKTPVHSILGYTDLLSNATSVKKCSNYLSQIKNSAQIILTLTNDILDYTNIENGNLAINNVPYSPGELLENLYSNTGILISQQNKYITLKKNIDPAISDLVLGDPIRLQQVMGNLLGNSVKFTEKGSIEFGIELVDNEHLRFYVADTGPGIPQQKQEHVFEKYTKLNRNCQGSGLGLYICNKIIKSMGGNITVSSHTGTEHGTTIAYTLQYSPYIKPADNGRPKTAHKASNGPSILLVEDNRINQVLMEAYSKKLGYALTIASTGQECCDIYQENRSFKLILMDIQLPDMDGMETMKKIREYEVKHGLSQIPIIALTASLFNTDKQSCLSAGFNDFLEKPVNLNTLTKIIEACLQDTETR